MTQTLFYAVIRRWWSRGWQAEWDLCPWCPRAYTRRGIERKARRWRRWGLEHELLRAHRKQWVRCHITARRDPFYAELRPVVAWSYSTTQRRRAERTA